MENKSINLLNIIKCTMTESTKATDAEVKDKTCICDDSKATDDAADDAFDDLNTSDAEVKDDDAEEGPDEFTASMLKLFKHADDPDDDFDKDQLAKGIAIESEHINNKWIQAAIAKAHLSEFGDYYTYLSDMEKTMKDKSKTTKDKSEAPADKSAESDENDI